MPRDDLPRKTARTPAALEAAGVIPRGRAAVLAAVAARYAIAVTPSMQELIDAADPADPIARQFVPSPEELNSTSDERADPIGDKRHSPVKGIVHRYPDRVLLMPVQVCPVYCRYCFRREAVGPAHAGLSPAETAEALDYIARHRGIFEVILSGGDPLMLAPAKLAKLIAALNAIPHVRVIRIHTRLPVVAPERVTAELAAALASETALYMVLHCNHPREIGAAMRGAARRLVAAGVPLLSQSVLLKGVNDDAATLEALFRALLAARIKPYYLHHADPAPGTAHFRTAISRGRALMRGLRGRLSGLAQPIYVLDIPDGHGKVPIGPHYLRRTGKGWRVTDPAGRRHAYPRDGKA